MTELPEPTQRDDTEHGVDYYTAADLILYAARVSAAKDAEIERLNTCLKQKTFQEAITEALREECDE